ncbi:VOC family protein [Arsenicibacter rosenii]|nr:VOC family protein [Arsenicibacter rosenii]
MKIEHIAVWVSDLETMKAFYTQYFGATGDGYYESVVLDPENNIVEITV